MKPTPNRPDPGLSERDPNRDPNRRPVRWERPLGRLNGKLWRP